MQPDVGQLEDYVTLPWEEWLTKMTKPQEWGDHMTLLGLANALQSNIQVFAID